MPHLPFGKTQELDSFFQLPEKSFPASFARAQPTPAHTPPEVVVPQQCLALSVAAQGHWEPSTRRRAGSFSTVVSPALETSTRVLGENKTGMRITPMPAVLGTPVPWEGEANPQHPQGVLF